MTGDTYSKPPFGWYHQFQISEDLFSGATSHDMYQTNQKCWFSWPAVARIFLRHKSPDEDMFGWRIPHRQPCSMSRLRFETWMEMVGFFMCDFCGNGWDIGFPEIVPIPAKVTVSVPQCTKIPKLCLVPMWLGRVMHLSNLILFLFNFWCSWGLWKWKDVTC